MSISYHLKSKSIIHEFLVDEIILANLDTGIYYSIRFTGVAIWQMLLAGNSADTIIAAFAQQYSINISHASEILNTFLNTLLSEEILVPVSTQTDPVSAGDFFPAWTAEYQLPSFEKYVDMKNLLMLDPIHEVDEQGWPSKSAILSR
jgi:hypothetical protein